MDGRRPRLPRPLPQPRPDPALPLHENVLQALHFAEIVLSRASKNPAALRVKLEAHELLLERSGRENFSEVRWLEAEIRDTREVLS